MSRLSFEFIPGMQNSRSHGNKSFEFWKKKLLELKSNGKNDFSDLKSSLFVQPT